jgi:hypothetical protein
VKLPGERHIRDGTNRAVADELLAARVPREDNVLDFQPPSTRHNTKVATG